MKRILLLGGYGNLGIPVAKYLVNSGHDIELILAGRNVQRATEVAQIIREETGYDKIESTLVDASNPDSLEEAFEGVDMVVVASSTLKYVKNVAEAAINAGTDYLDAQLSSPFKLDYLRGIEKEIIGSNRIFITDGGFHPGLLAAMVRWADLKAGPLVEANVYGALKLDWEKLVVSKDTVVEMIEEFKSYDNTILRDGKWIKPGWTYFKKFDFGDPFHTLSCMPMAIEELKMLPAAYPKLSDAGFYVTGFNKYVDYFIFPLMMLLLALGLKSIAARLFRYGLKFTRPPYMVKLVGEFHGEQGHLRMTFNDKDGYLLTAAPMVACLNQYLDGSISKPGLYWQAWVVEPERFMDDLSKMGLSPEVDHS